jgi:cell division septation protein DedD
LRAAPSPQPTRIASAPSGGSGYLVQVSSQRSEADAQAAYRTLRSRYSSVLGDHQPVIRRADLGSRGVFYRAMVGPFGSREEAIQLCSNLKSAGGDCVVQSN